MPTQTQQIRQILSEAADQLAAVLGHTVTIIPHDHKVSNIVKYAAYYFKVPESRILSGQRHRPLVVARTAVVYLLTHLEPEKTLAAIGKEINRNHATVINIRKKYIEDIKHDKEYEERVNKFIQSYIAGEKDWNRMQDEMDALMESAKEVAHIPVNFKLKKALEPFMGEGQVEASKQDRKV